MISFIIIGRNEGWKITTCLESVFRAIENNMLVDCDVIFVDSKSSDDSVQRAKKFKGARIFQITGQYNAAVARNIGGSEAKGDVLFFLDGDMELESNFIAEALKLIKSGIKYFSGQIKEVFYDEDWQILGSRIAFPSNKLNRFDLTNGGAYGITRELWNLAEGMKTKYTKSQDIDLAYRLVRKGFPLFRSDVTFVTHHTKQYNYKTTVLKELMRVKLFLYRGLLMREHFFNRPIQKRNIRINYTIILLFLTLLSIPLLKSCFSIVPYFVIVVLRSYVQFSKIRCVAKVNYLIILFKLFLTDFLHYLAFYVFSLEILNRSIYLSENSCRILLKCALK
jgi:glycosyltransferase involved in cell wall biosynthesis